MCLQVVGRDTKASRLVKRMGSKDKHKASKGVKDKASKGVKRKASREVKRRDSKEDKHKEDKGRGN